MNNDNLKFWFFKSMNLFDITKELEEILQLPDYYHDGEDTWEWCESYEKSDELYFNIYREHNSGIGRYECPVILIYNRIRKYNQDEIDKLGEVIAEKLEVEVFWGNIQWNRQQKNNFIPEYEYHSLSVYKV